MQIKKQVASGKKKIQKLIFHVVMKQKFFKLFYKQKLVADKIVFVVSVIVETERKNTKNEGC